VVKNGSNTWASRPTQKVGGRANDSEQIVEVVGYPTGKLADGFHFLGLPQRPLSLREFWLRHLSLSNIPPVSVDQVAFRGGGRRFPRLPVVLASGYSHVLAEAGTHGFPLLHKPYRSTIFLKCFAP
jgi:hypothetical protein